MDNKNGSQKINFDIPNISLIVHNIHKCGYPGIMEIRIMDQKITVDILNRSLIYTIYTNVGIMDNKNANI